MQVSDLPRILSSLLNRFGCQDQLSLYQPLVNEYGFEKTIIAIKEALDGDLVPGYIPSSEFIRSLIIKANKQPFGMSSKEIEYDAKN